VARAGNTFGAIAASRAEAELAEVVSGGPPWPPMLPGTVAPTNVYASRVLRGQARRAGEA
jgi:hypothetical protein